MASGRGASSIFVVIVGQETWHEVLASLLAVGGRVFAFVIGLIKAIDEWLALIDAVLGDGSAV